MKVKPSLRKIPLRWLKSDASSFRFSRLRSRTKGGKLDGHENASKIVTVVLQRQGLQR
jgi:hypothetical protein